MKELLQNISPNGAAALVAGIVASEVPDCPAKLTSDENKIWKHVTEALKQYDLIHLTDGLMISIICKTYVRWINAEKQLQQYADDNNGVYMVTTPNGYQQPHQLFHLASRLKKELLDWLPEAALTIPGFNKQIESRSNPEQGKLFDDPVTRHRNDKAKIGMIGIAGGKK